MHSDIAGPNKRRILNYVPTSMKRFLIIGTFFVIVSVLFWLAARTASPNMRPTALAPGAGSAPRDIPTLPPSSIPNEQLTVRFVLAFTPISVPASLPIYTTRLQAIEQSWNQIAQGLGFTGTGTSPKDTSTMRWWTNSSGTLKVYSLPARVTFTAAGDPIGPPTEQEAASALSTFISRVGITGGAIKLSATKVQFVATNGAHYTPTQGAPSASMAIASLEYQINNTPLITSSGLPIEATAQVHTSGALRSVTAPIPPLITSSAEKDTVPLAHAASHLNNNRGVLVSIRSRQPDETSITDINFSSVAISRVALLYMHNVTTLRLIPVYAFEGTVTGGSPESRGAIVTYLVPATYEQL